MRNQYQFLEFNQAMPGLPADRIHLTQHSFKCYLKSSVQFNNGLFHIFSGPLFANVQGYVYLDLMIWGLSPLTFMFLKPKITKSLKQGGKHIKPTTLKILIIVCFIIMISYFFLNYSPLFNWNYFSRTFNLDMGYFVFDMMLRTLELLIDLQEDDQDKQCDAYCEIQHTSITFAYGIVFFLASTFEINERNNGPIIFAISTLFSCFSIVLIPTLFYCFNKSSIQSYREIIPVSEELETGQWQTEQLNSSDSEQDQQNINPINSSSIGYFLIYTSLLLNMNYFSLWMMEPLGTDSQSSYQQYNITVQMVSGFFLISSIGNYVGGRLFVFFRYAKYFAKILLFMYGILVMAIYYHYQVNFVSLIVIGYGFHSVCSIELASLISRDYKLNYNYFLYPEIFAYFILPLFCTVANIGQTNLSAYSLISGAFLAGGALIL